jgi:hypothetical protein
MAGRVEEPHGQASHRQRVVIVDLHQVRSQAGEELALRLVHVHLRRHAGEQLLDAWNAPRHAPRRQAAADVVLMGVGHERADDGHVGRLGRLHDRVDLPRGVHDDTLARPGVADEVDEVLHRPELELAHEESRLAHSVLIP